MSEFLGSENNNSKISSYLHNSTLYNSTISNNKEFLNKQYNKIWYNALYINIHIIYINKLYNIHNMIQSQNLKIYNIIWAFSYHKSENYPKLDGSIEINSDKVDG